MQPKGGSKHQPRGRFEDPKFEIPDRHTGFKGPGTNAHGDIVGNQVYRQPWVENDPVEDNDSPKVG